MSNEKAIIDLVVGICKTEEVRDEPDLDLFEAGLLDSMTFVELIVGLERILGVTIPPTEVERDEVASITKILALAAEFA